MEKFQKFLKPEGVDFQPVSPSRSRNKASHMVWKQGYVFTPGLMRNFISVFLVLYLVNSFSFIFGKLY